MGIMLLLVMVLAIFVVVSEVLHTEEKEMDEGEYIEKMYGKESTKYIEYKWDQLEKNGKKF